MKKTAIILALVLLVSVTLVGCKKEEAAPNTPTDAVTGTWESEEIYDMVSTWTFDGSGKCTLVNTVNMGEGEEDFVMDMNGTYTLDETAGTITIAIDVWGDSKVYEYKVEGNTLYFTATHPYDSNEVLTKK